MKHETERVVRLRPDTAEEAAALNAVFISRGTPLDDGVAAVLRDPTEGAVPSNVAGRIVFVNHDGDGSATQWEEIVAEVRALSESAGDALKALTHETDYVWYECL